MFIGICSITKKSPKNLMQGKVGFFRLKVRKLAGTWSSISGFLDLCPLQWSLFMGMGIFGFDWIKSCNGIIVLVLDINVWNIVFMLLFVCVLCKYVFRCSCLFVYCIYLIKYMWIALFIRYVSVSVHVDLHLKTPLSL